MRRSSLDEAGSVIRLRGPLRKIRVCTGQYIGDEGCPFMKRWVIIHDNGAGIRLHRFMPNHHESIPHDHPFGFLTIVLRGGYTDISIRKDQMCLREVTDVLRVGSVRWRSAHHLHMTKTGPAGAWTFVVNGPKTRTWGFINRLGRWIPWMDFTEKRAACEDLPS